MKIACFYPTSTFQARPWSLTEGLAGAFQRLGHETLGVGIDVSGRGLHSLELPSAAVLNELDGIVISGVEEIYQQLLALYPDWSLLAAPKVSWMHQALEQLKCPETMRREIKRFADVICSPAVQDESFGLHWLPFGVDTEVFKPDHKAPKRYDAAFVGPMSERNKQFLKELEPYLSGIDLLASDIEVEDLGGICVQRRLPIYIENLRQIKVFVNLPHASDFVPAAVYEVQACGTFLITPAIVHAGNFDDLQAHFYDAGKPEKLAESIRFCLQHEAERTEAARQCCSQIHRLHRLELRCQALIRVLQEQKVTAACG